VRARRALCESHARHGTACYQTHSIFSYYYLTRARIAAPVTVSLAMIGASCVVSLLTVELASDKLFNAFGPLYRFVRDWRASASKAQAP